MEPFKRQNSIKYIIYRSLRLTKKKKPLQEIQENKQEKENVFFIRHASQENLVVHNHKVMREESCQSIFGKIEMVQTPCTLIQYFLKEGKQYDKDCTLTSFERKRRNHFTFGLDHHANEHLFCPEQASQIELQFQSAANTEVVIRVTAPNGESSNLLRPTRNDYVTFNPTKVGCGHGTWIVDVACRDGCRFKHVFRKEIQLKGQGVLMYHIDPDYRLRQVDRLWLSFR